MNTLSFLCLIALGFVAAEAAALDAEDAAFDSAEDAAFDVEAAAFDAVEGLVTLPDGTKVNATNIVRYRSKTYFINTDFQVNYYKAAQFCRQIGFQLLSIQSKRENDFIGDYLYKNGYDGVVNGRVKYYFWSSGNNQGDNENYVWLSNGQPLRYNAFYPGEPNNYQGGEHCLEVRYHSKNNLGLNWNDYFCDRNRYVICEKRKNEC